MNTTLKYTFFVVFLIAIQISAQAPAVYSSVKSIDGKLVYLAPDGEKYFEKQIAPKFTRTLMLGNPAGTEEGIKFDFKDNFNGTLYYGFIPYGDSKHPQAVWFKKSAEIKGGKAEVKIAGNLSGKYDMIGWEKSGNGTLGYRVVTNEGDIIYDGKVTFKGKGPFEVAATIIEGPFVDLVTDKTAVISFSTNKELQGKVEINGRDFKGLSETKDHEINIDGLLPSTEYEYTVIADDTRETFSFKTAPEPGSRSSFIFAYASDSRHAAGGGERKIYGANAYIMKKIMALCTQEGASFMQFTGDFINGYLTDIDEMKLQYTNWKKAIAPFAHYLPVYEGMGNHEALMKVFVSDSGKRVWVDRFPFESESGEAAFGDVFVNPGNGPSSEDGSEWDPHKSTIDFPSYKENVYYYTFDNVAVIVLNSNYFYAPHRKRYEWLDGNLHGYIMDNQLKWLEETLEKLEKDKNIDHIFTTQHTPVFPNGGHVQDDMWYNGDNTPRPRVRGRDVKYGIIERRDQYLDLIINKSSKVRAVLTGDEHNYARTRIDKKLNIYPENWDKEKLEISRTIYQINNGAAGAPYYAQEKTPWSDAVSSFTTQNALVLFYVKGESLRMKVKNPDTLELIDELILN